MVEAKIKSTPDEQLQYRSQEVKANNKTITTPIKSIDRSRIDSKIFNDQKIKCINELYAGLSDEKLKSMIKSSDHSLTRKLNNIKSKFQNSSEELELCFLEFKGESMPSTKEIECMTDLAYKLSDITPIPMLSDFNKRIDENQGRSNQDSSKFKDVKDYLKNSIEIIEQLSNKPIMGYIPDYEPYFEKLIKIYADRGINTFYFDAHLSNLITLAESLRAFTRELSNQEMLEKSFVHMTNPRPGNAIRNSIKSPAKDILGFGLGIDSLGERHMQQRFPNKKHNQVFSSTKDEKMNKNTDYKPKLFNKKTYGYLKTSKKDEIKEFYPNDSKIDVSEFLNSGKHDKIERAFNAEQLSLESTHLKNNIRQSDPILDYINKKADIKKEDIEILKRAKIN